MQTNRYIQRCTKDVVLLRLCATFVRSSCDTLLCVACVYSSAYVRVVCILFVCSAAQHSAAQQSLNNGVQIYENIKEHSLFTLQLTRNTKKNRDFVIFGFVAHYSPKSHRFPIEIHSVFY